MIVLAGGASRRTGAENKLLLPFLGRTIIESTISSILAAGADDVIVVTGHDAERIRSRLSGFPIRIVHNAGYEQGMSTSIRAGVQAAQGAVGICLADMPFIAPSTVRTLIEALENHPDKIIVPTYGETTGHPVLFAARYREELLHLEGDRGARLIIQNHAGDLVQVETNDPGILRDIDTIEDYLGASG